MKKLTILIFVVAVLLGGFYFLTTKKASAPTKTPQVVISPTPTSSITMEQQIINALSEKNNWDKSKVELNVAKVEGDYAKGDVKFKDEMGGGLWFAAKVNGSWKIVFDGNGMILCENLNNYPNFPSDLIPQCLNKVTGDLITR